MKPVLLTVAGNPENQDRGLIIQGSGSAWPVPFRRPREVGGLLLATDGLLKYTSAERIIAVCRDHSADVAAQRLIELLRYPSGALPDDVTIILIGI